MSGISLKRHGPHATIFKLDTFHATAFHPKAPNSLSIGFFLFNPGHKYRVGPHDIYVKIAQTLTGEGITVITPDCTNMGDDFSRFFYPSIQEHQTDIVRGSQVADASKAVEFFCKEFQFEHVFLSGLCGGTRTAIGVAKKLNKVSGVAAWACPFQIPGRPSLVSQSTTQSSPPKSNVSPPTKREQKSNPLVTLKKLIQMDIDWKYQRTKLEKLSRKIRNIDYSFNYGLAKEVYALEKRGVPIKFIYSENDPHYFCFRDYYVPWRTTPILSQNITVIPRTNHVVANQEGLKQLIQEILAFIQIQTS